MGWEAQGGVADRASAPRRPALSLDDLGILADVRAALFGRATPEISVGRYRLGACVGHGGSGRVYRAHDPELDREVAIKLVTPREDDCASRIRSRVLEEARALGRLSHPNVVAVYDVGEYDLGPEAAAQGEVPGHGVFIAMELLSGSSLDRWLHVAPREATTVIEHFVAAGRGLAAAHAAGLVHRDLKPTNLFITDEGVVKILDFGLASARSQPSTSAASGSQTGTESGGTPWYMAPEQYAEGITDARSDQYSFCLALHEALFGRIAAEGPRALQRRKVAGTIEIPRIATVPRHVRRTLTRGLSPNPTARFASLEDLLHALRGPGLGKSRVLLGSGGLACVVLAVLGVGLSPARPTVLQAGVFGDIPADAHGSLARAEGLLDEGRFEEAAELCNSMDSAERAPPSEHALSLMCRAKLDAFHGRFEAAAAGFERAYWYATEHELNGIAALAAARAATNLLGTARIDAALEWVRHGEAAARRANLEIGHVQADLAIARASALVSRGRYADALPHYERAHRERSRASGPQTRSTATALKLVANCLTRVGRSDEALPMHTTALETLKVVLGDEHLEIATALNDRASALQNLGRHEEALSDLERGLAIVQDAYANDHPSAGMIRHNIAYSLSRLERHDKAIEEYRRALAIRSAAHGPDHYKTLLTIKNLGGLLIEQGSLDEGEHLLLEALVRCEQSEAHPLQRSVLDYLARAAEARGNQEAARTYRDRSRDLARILSQERAE